MTIENRTAHPHGQAPLNIVTAYYPENSYLCGVLHTRKGWHWWAEAIAPNGASLSGVVQGPFPTEADALANARELVGEPTPIRVLVALEGGCISGASASVAGVELVKLDYDTEGSDEADLFDIPQTGGGTAEAWLSFDTADHDPDFIAGAIGARPTDPEGRLAMLRRDVAGLTDEGRAAPFGRARLAEIAELEAMLAEDGGGESYAYEPTLARYDAGEINDEQAIAELEANGWAERRARTILEQHQAA